MRWTVEGADAQTGQDRTIQVEAKSREDAEREARARGVLPSATYKETADAGAMPTLNYIGRAAHESAPPGTQVGLAPPRGKAPDYTGIVVGAAVLRITGAMAAIAGIVLCAMTLNEISGGGLGTALPVGFAWIISGLVTFMLGSLALAVRDIARNSFRR